MRYVVAIVDLQFGSTGKGQIAGTLAHKWLPDTVATAWGPNAGHTYWHEGPTGPHKFVHTMLPVSALAPSVENILIGPGSVVNLEKLGDEIIAAGKMLRGKRLIIHPQAALLTPNHAEVEKSLERIGSTMKGTAAATIDKVMRYDWAVVNRDYGMVVHEKLARATTLVQMGLAVSSYHYDRAVDRSEKLMLEGAQGFSLGIHTDFYPYTTSRDVSTAQLLADCRIPFPAPATQPFHVVGVARTYPIRVANRFRDGVQIGHSGRCYEDQTEIQWAEIGREPELTTVTKLPRRIFTFSRQQVREAMRIMRPNSVALTFCDYVVPEEKVWGPEAPSSSGGEIFIPTELEPWVSAFPASELRMMSFGPFPSNVWGVRSPQLGMLDIAFLPGAK